jgi:HTH-type transcriptional regulator / antitoxin HigA
MKAFAIKNEVQYEEALAYVSRLMDAAPGSEQEQELELWGTLVEAYEDKVHPIPPPDPIEAIKFRMEQAGLTRKDMERYLGSPSKVSEVLSGKRPLSVEMMRRLHEGLGIPASSLLSKHGATLPSENAATEWRRFPLVEMRKRRWIACDGSAHQMKAQAEDLVRAFIRPFDAAEELPMCARQHVRDGRQMDDYALCAWKIRVMHLAKAQAVAPYASGTVNQDFVREVVRLSFFDNGPLLAKEFLAKHGVHLVTERHLPGTYLDGAALRMPDGHPVVALTLRFDRLDNFWFTLAHELAHVALHLDKDGAAFFDDLEARGTSEQESAADRMAEESLVPRTAWLAARLSPRSTADHIRSFASELRISPAIPAGRIRHEAGNHRLFWSLVGNGAVRALFEKPV